MQAALRYLKVCAWMHGRILTFSTSFYFGYLFPRSFLFFWFSSFWFCFSCLRFFFSLGSVIFPFLFFIFSLPVVFFLSLSIWLSVLFFPFVLGKGIRSGIFLKQQTFFRTFSSTAASKPKGVTFKVRGGVSCCRCWRCSVFCITKSTEDFLVRRSGESSTPCQQTSSFCFLQNVTGPTFP